MRTVGCWSVAALVVLLISSVQAGEQVYTLADAYQSALKTNETIRVSEENLVQSESRVDQAKTYLFPTVAGQVSYNRYNEVLPPGSTSFVFQPLDQITAGLVLTQPLYTGGRTLAGLRTAQTLRDVSARDLNSTRQDTMLSVATAYYAVLKAQMMVDKSRNSLERMERHKKVTEREAATRKTKANISNLLRARTLVSQARITLRRDESNLQIARQQLSLLTGLPDRAVVAEPAPQPPPPGNLEALKNTAFENRDDYAASRLNRTVAEENITIVKGAHYPQASAEAGLQYVKSSPATLMEGTVYYGGIRIQVPIFEGGLMKYQVSEAKSKLRQAELSMQYLQRSIETDVYEAYTNYQTISVVLDTLKLQYEDAQSNFSAVASLFEQGLASSLALIDAQQALFLAERELVNATYDQQVAILRLQRSTGLLGKAS